MNIDREKLLEDLKQDEGFRPYVYDDANGQYIGRGSTLRGNPTIGYGWNVSGNPISEDRAEIILGWFVNDTIESLFNALPWLSGSPEPVQRSLVNMAFNLGVNELLKFTTFLVMIKSSNYSGAAADLTTTLWYKQVPGRAQQIQQLLKSI